MSKNHMNDDWLTGNPDDINSTLYERKGYSSRESYLIGLAHRYNVNPDEVKHFADLLGEDDDFDGLVLTIEEYQDSMRARYRQLLREREANANSENTQQQESGDLEEQEEQSSDQEDEQSFVEQAKKMLAKLF